MKRALRRLALVLGLVAAFGIGYGIKQRSELSSFAREPFGSPEPKRVEVPRGAWPKSVAALLAAHGVVKSADEFFALVRQQAVGSQLKAGEYEFLGPLTPIQVLDKLVDGRVRTYRFTVPEGLRVEEILPLLARSELKLDLVTLTQLSTDKTFVHQTGVPLLAANFEGFLFPDTYIFSRGFTEQSVLKTMVVRTLDEYKKADAQRKAGNTLDLFQTITLASIVEKETGAPEDRPRIACLFHNRLRLKMKLQTDPTVLYAKRLWSGVFSKNITKKDLLTEHPYNTYTVDGLPPGPIASPGAESIRAVLNPPDCRDLYFVSRNDGTSVFCPDLKCHNEAVKKWQIDYWRHRRASSR